MATQAQRAGRERAIAREYKLALMTVGLSCYTAIKLMASFIRWQLKRKRAGRERAIARE